MKRTRVKICGMSDASIVSKAVDLGVDAIGLIFFEKSPRNVSIEQAKAIREIVPAFVSLVGVFVNESVDVVNEISSEVGLDLIQLHGDEDAEYAKKLKTPYIRAIRAKDTETISQQANEHMGSRGILLDAYHEGKYGGTGEGFDLSMIPHELKQSVIIAGGITPDNVAELLSRQPYAIDVNSGVESEPGKKELAKVEQLFEVINQAKALT